MMSKKRKERQKYVREELEEELAVMCVCHLAMVWWREAGSPVCVYTYGSVFWQNEEERQFTKYLVTQSNMIEYKSNDE